MCAIIVVVLIYELIALKQTESSYWNVWEPSEQFQKNTSQIMHKNMWKKLSQRVINKLQTKPVIG